MLKSLMTQICIFHLLEILKNCRMTGLMEVGNWDLPEGNQGCICVKELTNTYPRFAAKSWSTNRISLSFFNIKVCFLEKKIILFPYSLLFLTKTPANPFSHWNVFLWKKREMMIVRHIYSFDKIICLTVNMEENCSVGGTRAGSVWTISNYWE